MPPCRRRPPNQVFRIKMGNLRSPWVGFIGVATKGFVKEFNLVQRRGAIRQKSGRTVVCGSLLDRHLEPARHDSPIGRVSSTKHTFWSMDTVNQVSEGPAQAGLEEKPPLHRLPFPIEKLNTPNILLQVDRGCIHFSGSHKKAKRQVPLRYCNSSQWTPHGGGGSEKP